MAYFIGLMSGTSMDGIDAALVSFDPHPTILATHTTQIPAALKSTLQQLLQNTPITLTLLGEADTALAQLFADTAIAVLKKTTLTQNSIVAIGSHGQTIFHHPNGSLPFTMQLGDPNIIAARTGITTVADFRRKDIALGGQGAPLVPAFHAAVFPRKSYDCYILNLGGIANITHIPADSEKSIIGFDTGPANTLLDLWCEKHTGLAYDKNGAWAKQGCIQNELLTLCLNDPYFSRPFPKSTGREYFNLNWLTEKMKGTEATTPENIQATLTALTAHTIAKAIHATRASKTGELWLCGGGANNVFLVKQLQQLLPDTQLHNTDEIGIPTQWMECVAFAWLAKQTLEKKSGNLCSVTGASREAILGGIFYPG